MKPATCFFVRLTSRALRAVSLMFATVLLLAVSAVRAAEPLPVLRLSVLQFGTPHWELEHLKREGLDVANGFRLELRLVADLPASRLALGSGSVDGAVSDLLWAQARYEAGTAFRYVPFSSQIGEVLVPEGSAIDGPSDLRGKRIGVAGGPDGLGWLLLKRLAAREGIDLATEAEVQYAAPPLLNEVLRRGQVDALVTFWHFSARLRGEGGARTAFRLADLVGDLGLSRDLPVLGYLIPDDWAAAHPAVLHGFTRAIRQAKAQLRDDPAAWQSIRMLMRAEDDAVFAALRNSFVEGIPGLLDEARVADLHRLLRLTGSPPEGLMPASLFQDAP
ncbi:ABC transporter substrate-binding protein [Stutzerimonas chloritidismutans]|uniref:ABC transporter substrate-binding protein n=1 Tax=Stutzerimonas chloritidismutans TaxID=203192 RepID=UPI003F17DD0A